MCSPVMSSKIGKRDLDEVSHVYVTRTGAAIIGCERLLEPSVGATWKIQQDTRRSDTRNHESQEKNSDMVLKSSWYSWSIE